MTMINSHGGNTTTSIAHAVKDYCLKNGRGDARLRVSGPIFRLLTTHTNAGSYMGFDQRTGMSRFCGMPVEVGDDGDEASIVCVARDAVPIVFS